MHIEFIAVTGLIAFVCQCEIGHLLVKPIVIYYNLRMMFWLNLAHKSPTHTVLHPQEIKP